MYEPPVIYDRQPEINTSDPIYPHRRPRLRTFLIPALFLVIHLVIINIVATVVLLFVMFSQMAGGNPLEILTDPARLAELLNQLLSDHYPLITVISSVFLIPAYLIFLRLQRKKDARYFLTEKPLMREILPAMAVTIGLLGVINLWFSLLTHLQESNAWIDRLMTEYAQTAAAFTPANGYLWLILGIGIMTPVAEELLFRGIVQGELRKVMPEWGAILIQGFVFALFHMQPIQISYVILPGIVLGLLYAWTRSIWIPIVIHVTFNLSGSVLPALIESDTVLQQIVSISQLAFIAIGILCLIFLYRKRKTQPADEWVVLKGRML